MRKNTKDSIDRAGGEALFFTSSQCLHLLFVSVRTLMLSFVLAALFSGAPCTFASSGDQMSSEVFVTHNRPPCPEVLTSFREDSFYHRRPCLQGEAEHSAIDPTANGCEPAGREGRHAG